MITAVSEATVPKISVILRKAYGAGLYAMAGPPSRPTPAWRSPPPRSPSWGRRRPSMPFSPTGSQRSRTRPSARPSWPSAAASTRRTSTCSGSSADLVVDAVDPTGGAAHRACASLCDGRIEEPLADRPAPRRPSGVMSAAGRGEVPGPDPDPDADEEEEAESRQAKAPWHFKLIVVGSVGYLGYRFYQGISWLAHHL